MKNNISNAKLTSKKPFKDDLKNKSSSKSIKYKKDGQDFKNLPNLDGFLNSQITQTPIATVAIMGRPNVGKSSLFNRLNKQNIAITHHLSGSTRDINKKDLQLNRFAITLVDTGGLELDFDILKNIDSSFNYIEQLKIDTKNKTKQDIKKEVFLKSQISMQSYSILKECDLILFIVDGQNLPDDKDIKIFRELSKRKPTILVINKVDNDAQRMLAESEFVVFGVPFLCICVSHNRFITQLLTKLEDKIQDLLNKKILKNKINFNPPSSLPLNSSPLTKKNIVNIKDQENNEASQNEKRDKERDDTKKEEININIGIIGRPNVGKSSLLNALVKKNRSLVSDMAGTTVDPIDEKISYKDHSFTFVDTAGIRQRSKILGIEKYALLRTQEVLKSCQIALVVLDASSELVELDERICSEAFKHNLGLIILLNKWDIRKDTFEAHMLEYRRKFKFLDHVPVITVSSLTLQRIDSLKNEILKVYNNLQFRIPTAKLNNLMLSFLQKHPIPSDHGKIVKVYYATQIGVAPLEIVLIMNRPKALHFSYKRYLVNCIRKEFGLQGVPILIQAKDKTKKELLEED